MPTYITLLRWTTEGARDVKKSPSRLDAARRNFQSMGVTMRAFYMTTGRCDMVAVFEAPDDTTLAKALLSTISAGAVQTETMRAFTEDEYRSILGSL
ncbi:MAG TPA: GYD domain-containing protein [Bryobacteraceae bacterium]|nr:GYD domain-containing protein [Bryobacteraceae bacterium]